MNTRLLLLLATLLSMASCTGSDSEPDPIELILSQSSFNVEASNNSLNVTVTTTADWQPSSNQDWCIATRGADGNQSTLTIAIAENAAQSSRQALVTIAYGKLTKEIAITQKAPTASPNYRYQIPVIFHVLYQTPSNKNQYVTQTRLASILATCNKLYQDKMGGSSADINLEFVLATKGANNKTLTEPGVNRVLWKTPTMSCMDFMTKNINENINLLWDTDTYINIILYTFTEEGILGVSHLPYTVAPYQLEGLYQQNTRPTHTNLTYPHSVSINNTYIYPPLSDKYYDGSDVTVTLAHELGHYLGLHHPFAGGDDETDVTTCEESDYCPDTPSYNINQYNNWISSLDPTDPNQYTFVNATKRKSCEGIEFTSRNIMDYGVTYSNQFTPDQRTRIRYVLTYSPLIPGPKIRQGTTRSLPGQQDLPMRVMR